MSIVPCVTRPQSHSDMSHDNYTLLTRRVDYRTKHVSPWWQVPDRHTCMWRHTHTGDQSNLPRSPLHTLSMYPVITTLHWHCVTTVWGCDVTIQNGAGRCNSRLSIIVLTLAWPWHVGDLQERVSRMRTMMTGNGIIFSWMESIWDGMSIENKWDWSTYGRHGNIRAGGQDYHMFTQQGVNSPMTGI